MPTRLLSPEFSGVTTCTQGRGMRAGFDRYSSSSCPSRLYPLSSLRARPNLELSCGPNLWRAYNAGPCCPETVPAYFVKTQANPGEVAGKCFSTQSACEVYGRRVITMPSFRIYPQAFLGRMFWDLPIRASCVSSWPSPGCSHHPQL